MVWSSSNGSPVYHFAWIEMYWQGNRLVPLRNPGQKVWLRVHFTWMFLQSSHSKI